MKYGIREICDVVLRAKATQKIGSMVFTRDMPVLYFDSLKTSSLEGAATTVYAQGGRGNTRLIAWEGEKTLTFTMEDALISPISLSVLSGAGVIEATEGDDMAKIKHATETAAVVGGKCEITYPIHIDPANNFYAYLIPLDSFGDIKGEPVRIVDVGEGLTEKNENDMYDLDLSKLLGESGAGLFKVTNGKAETEGIKGEKDNLDQCDLVMIDYYYKSETAAVTMMEIDAQHFAGNYYLEASTLWRNKAGKDVAAEFIIPNCKIQSNFTFSLASTGDPSTFTFTMDAFPDYTKYNKKDKVLCAIRIEEEDAVSDAESITGVKIPLTEPVAAAAYSRNRSYATSEIE